MALLVGADQEERFAGPDPRRARGPKSRVADGSVWTGSLGQARETPRLSAGAAPEAERLWERSLADDGVGNPRRGHRSNRRSRAVRPSGISGRRSQLGAACDSGQLWVRDWPHLLAEHDDLLIAGDLADSVRGFERKSDGDLGGLAWAADEGVDATSGHVVGSGVRDNDRRGPPVEAGPVGVPPGDRGVIE